MKIIIDFINVRNVRRRLDINQYIFIEAWLDNYKINIIEVEKHYIAYVENIRRN
jgi:hypothetical protein